MKNTWTQQSKTKHSNQRQKNDDTVSCDYKYEHPSVPHEKGVHTKLNITHDDKEMYFNIVSNYCPDIYITFLPSECLRKYYEAKVNEYLKLNPSLIIKNIGCFNFGVSFLVEDKFRARDSFYVYSRDYSVPFVQQMVEHCMSFQIAFENKYTAPYMEERGD